MSKQKIIIDGVEFSPDSKDIIKDFKGKWILNDKKQVIHHKILTHKTDGLLETLDTKNLWVDYREIDELIKSGEIIYLECRKCSLYLVKDYIIEGNGKLHKSIDDEFVWFDDYLNTRRNNPDKFRVFNNIVSYFDIKNSNISDDDKKLIIKRDVDFGVRSLTYNFFEGLKYTFGRRKIS